MAETIEILKTNLPQALWETFFMVGTSAIIGVVFGLLIGLVLFLVGSNLFHKNIFLHHLADFVVNAIRSLPFLILLITLIPLSAMLIGDPYTPAGGAIALSIAAIPFTPESLNPHLPKSTMASLKPASLLEHRRDRSFAK